MTRGPKPPALPWWQHLEALRQDKGWSRAQLAQKAGVARTTLDRWKVSPRQPLVPTITEVADRLEIDRHEALRLAGIPGPTAAEEAAAAAEEATAELEDALQRWLRDPGEKGIVLRGLLRSWEEEGGDGTGRDTETG